jgi:DNA-binding NtrC family response regulator
MTDGIARVLLVDDDEALCQTLEAGLVRREFAVVWRTSGDAALALLDVEDFDVVVTDLNLGQLDGIALCQRIALRRPDIPVIVLTAFGSFDTAVAAIRAGAYDFISKPVQIDVLGIALRRASQHKMLREEVRRLRSAAPPSSVTGELLGTSPAMRAVHDVIARVADSEASVLVTGESGTGKEVVARALHKTSRRKDGPFVAVNCAAMPEPLLESELFGHARGAFTDAKEAHAGLFAQAARGTIFLDEIGDMPIGLQPKLLRVIQERMVRPLGASGEIAVDVRIVAATNRDLQSAIEERRFREDLYFRLNVIHIELPPLRARGGDVLMLAAHWIAKVSEREKKRIVGVSQSAAEMLVTYTWPGNVRELQNCVEHAVALARYDQITPEDLPDKIRSYKRSHVIVAGDDPSELVPMEEVERRYILRVLEAVAGNKTAAARVLGIERKTLYRKLERYGMDG